MVLILSIDKDYSTDVVIQWLKYFKHPFIRINSYELFEKNFYWDINNNEIKINNKLIELEDVNVIWYRRFGFFPESSQYKILVQKFGVHESFQIMREFSAIYNGIFSVLKDKKWLLDPLKVNLNKLEVLMRAKQFGLNIPESHIINNKEKLTELMSNRAFISKSAKDPMFLKKEDGFYSMYTTEINENNCKVFPSSFFPSLVQERITKAYELRIFLIKSRLYSMAIFSQSNKQTEVDFRKYAWQNPNRCIPYKLPEIIEKKILNLLSSYDLDTASVDLIKTPDGTYYFLEINPAGQFGMVDFNCNYGLHKEVAQFLVENDK